MAGVRRRTTRCLLCGHTGRLGGDIPCPCPLGDRYLHPPPPPEDLYVVKVRQRRAKADGTWRNRGLGWTPHTAPARVQEAVAAIARSLRLDPGLGWEAVEHVNRHSFWICDPIDPELTPGELRWAWRLARRMGTGG